MRLVTIFVIVSHFRLHKHVFTAVKIRLQLHVFVYGKLKILRQTLGDGRAASASAYMALTALMSEIVRIFKKICIEKDVKMTGLTEPVFIL